MKPESDSVHQAAPDAQRACGVHRADSGVSAPSAEGSVEYGVNPGRVGRDGSFLWQMDTPSGAGMNLWSGKLSANNGYPEDYAIQAAILFEAAPELLEACRAIVAWDDAEKNAKPWAEDNGAGWWARLGMCAEAFDKARAAIAKATGEQQ